MKVSRVFSAAAGLSPRRWGVVWRGLLMFLGVMGVWGQTPGEVVVYTPRAAHISLNDGLSQATVNCIFQDSQGYMWLGTQDGLNRYNGYEIKVFALDPEDPSSLLGNGVNVVLESSFEKGLVWVGTDSGLCAYDMRSGGFRSRGNGFLLGEGLDRAEILSAEEEPGGRCIWFGSRNKGLFRLERGSRRVTLIKSDSSGNAAISAGAIHAMAFDGSGYLWLGSAEGGLIRYDPQTGRSRVFPPHVGGLEEDRIEDILCDRDGDMWIAAGSSHLMVCGGERLRWDHPQPFQPASPPDVSGFVPQMEAIFQDRDGMIWMAGEAAGVYSFDKISRRWSRYIFSNDLFRGAPHFSVTQMYQDYSGSLWIGAFSMGVFRLDAMSRNFRSYRPGDGENVNSKDIWAIGASRGGGYWIGGNGGLHRFHLARGVFERIHHNRSFPNNPEHTRVLSLEEDPGYLWVGVDGGGVYRFNPARGEWLNIPPDHDHPGGLSDGHVTCLKYDRRGDLWLGTLYGGVARLKKEDRERLHFHVYNQRAENGDMALNQIQGLYEDLDGTMWAAATEGGLLKYDAVSDSFGAIRNEPGKPRILTDNRILSILRDSRGFLWVGAACGLNCLNPASNRWKHYYISDGLPNSVIYGLLEDNTQRREKTGYIWMSTNKGVARLDPVTDAIETFDFHDGLQGNEFNSNAYFKDKNGLLFFGGVEGFSVIDPADVRKNLLAPAVIISGFLLFNREAPIGSGGDSPLRESISMTSEVRLAHYQNSFTFEFAALNFINPEKNRYAYKLEGFDAEWNYLERRRPASYTNIPPGEYVFRVKGSNNDGVWNLEGAQVKVVVKPPFWRRWWFVSLMLAMAAVLVWFIFRVHSDGLRQLYAKQALEEEMKLKADFTAMLVHDLRSPMTAVLSYAELLAESPEKLDMKRTGAVLSRTARNMLRIINNMLDISKFEAGKMELSIETRSMSDVVSPLLEIMQPLYERKGVQVLWKPDPGLAAELLPLDAEKIGEVIANLLGNAIKYTPSGGRVTMRFQRVGSEGFEFSVTDQGPGVAQEKQGLLFEKYAQLTGKTGDYKGTGLGLAVSRMIIEAHGGTIGFRPGVGGAGSNFWFRLPAGESGLESFKSGNPGAPV